ncbi:hypothetical protein P3T76_008669 [Phytophthora citrophthora]|uniref:Uncharacterized protein n=1 Tax=Phytophthora citrophthora TaxID=4793 RepID=A0AAD9GIZ5_9STRA|nr:hypothetical protein P3T76_008669 [Phytophthora citrophthora]
MMTTQQQSADQVKPFAYPHGTPAASSSPANESAMSGGTAVANSAAASPPTADRKRKQPPSPTDDADAKGSADAAEASDKNKETQPQPSKKSRRELPPHTVAILKGWMLSREHVKHPYPTDEVSKEIKKMSSGCIR